MNPDSPLLEVRHLHTVFRVAGAGDRPHRFSLFPRPGLLHAVRDVSFSLDTGETLGLVGESGCGKSTLARTLAGLCPGARGTIRFRGAAFPADRRERARKIQMIFQDPYASLNPRMTVYDTLAEPLLVHRLVPPEDVPAKVATLMDQAGLARRYVRKYPHEFSGGQRQRIAIARALAVEPDILVADEPVSALDVSVQAQILNLLVTIQRERGLALLFISHDLSVVRHIAHRVAVMYLGRFMETGPVARVFVQPLHPYTRALINAIPGWKRDITRAVLPGEPPSPLRPPQGCPFHPRCSRASDKCRQEMPGWTCSDPDHQVACFHPLDKPSPATEKTGQARIAHAMERTDKKGDV